MDEINVDVIVSNGTNVEVNSPSTSVNAFVNLPPPLQSTTDSPSIDYNAHVILPGPQGPPGIQGPVGPQGPQGNISGINDLNAQLIYLSGQDGVNIYTDNYNTIFISGNSGYFQSLINTTNNNLNITGNTLAADLLTTGITLQTNINTVASNLITTGNTLSTNLVSTGNFLSKKIDDLSGVSVLTYGNQLILGNKTFNGNTIINNLTITGTETIVNTSVLNVANPYLLLNISGGASDGGIFFVTGSGLTGINDAGPIIGFDHSNKFKFGISTRNSDLSPLPDIASVQDIIAYSGVADNKFATIINLNSTGNDLQTQINTLSNKVIYTTGNQIKSGRLAIGDTILNATNPYTLSLQSNNQDTFLEILNSGGAGKGAFFGMNEDRLELYNYQGGDILFLTSENVSEGIERLYIKNNGNIGIGTNIPSEKLEVAGNIKANNLVYNTGNQTISGDTTFIDKINIKAIDGSSVGYIEGTSFANSHQTLKIQTAGQDENYIEINSAQNSINLGEDLFNITNNNGTLNFNSTNDENIAINGTRSLSADNISASFKEVLVNNRIDIKASDGELVGFISGESNSGSTQTLIINGFGGTDEQNVRIQSAGNSIQFGEANFTITNNNGVLNFNGGDDIYINNTRNLVGSNISASFKEVSANNLVYNTSNQNISGIKNFYSRPTLSGIGVSLIGEVSDNLVYTTGNQTISGIKTFATGVLISGNLQVFNTGIFNGLNLNNIDALSLSGVDINIASGNVNLTNRPTVNGTGVLLSGQNSFTVYMQVTNSNPVNDNISYFNNLPGGPSTLRSSKIFQIGETCIARKASWNQYLDTFTGIPNQNATGYFINVSTNRTGIISTVINATTAGISGFSYFGQIIPNIAVGETDYVVCGLKWGNYTPGFRPSGWRAGVNIYCYN